MCTHVCAEIRSLAEQSVTHAALVRLRPVVNGTSVLLQAALQLEPRWAVRTEIRIFIAVYLSHVTSQHGQQFKPLSTLRASERSLVGMFEDDMPPQQASPLKTDSTLTADMWSEIEVNFLVCIPCTCLSKGFATDTARIRPFSCVASHVLRQRRSKCTSTSTDAADEWLIFTAVMLMHVPIEKFHFPILLIALGARMPLPPMRRVLVMCQTSSGLKPSSTVGTAILFCTSFIHSVWQETKKFVSPILRSCSFPSKITK